MGLEEEKEECLLGQTWFKMLLKPTKTSFIFWVERESNCILQEMKIGIKVTTHEQSSLFSVMCSWLEASINVSCEGMTPLRTYI